MGLEVRIPQGSQNTPVLRKESRRKMAIGSHTLRIQKLDGQTWS
jgi:hypothetical protein